MTARIRDCPSPVLSSLYLSILWHIICHRKCILAIKAPPLQVLGMAIDGNCSGPQEKNTGPQDGRCPTPEPPPAESTCPQGPKYLKCRM